MPRLFGQSLTPEDLAARVGRIDQVAGARAFVFEDGPARGMRGIDVWTGSGLAFTVHPDRCLDIGAARLGGRALAWESSTGPVAPERFEPPGFHWLRSFSGGLVTTCGLRHFGAPDADPNGETWGLHGRASHLSAEDVAIERGWEGDDYRLLIRGRVVEAEVFKPTLVLERTLATALGSREIRILDRLCNAGHEPSSAMLLYHINLGWPLLSERSRLLTGPASVTACSDAAAAGQDRRLEMLPPTRGFTEHTYMTEPEAAPDGLCRAALVNPDLDGGTALLLEWPKRSLPYMAEWKMMGQGTYVLGVEPCTCPFPPREDLRRRGLMPMLGPGESIETSLTLRVCQGEKELADVRRAVEAAG